ncbi:MAG: HEAT repeat domain-containing protein [Cyanobacteria bacterium P01_D01_bin.44]
MDKRFANLVALTEAEAITLLETPPDQLEEEDVSRYVAAAHLASFPSEASIKALMQAVKNTEDSLDNRITRRKAIESLGKLKVEQALPVIADCLTDEDCYTVEVTAWAIGEIGTQDPGILEAIAQLLEKPNQTYRVIIHTLANLNYIPALERIRPFMEAADEPTVSAAVSAVCRLTGDYTAIEKVVMLLQSDNVNARRGCLQDLIDARYYDAIPAIARCPISLVFRLRAIRTLAQAGMAEGRLTFADVQPSLEQVLLDDPGTLDLVHEYDQPPALDFAIQELYQTDFGRCYLATQTLLSTYADELPAALFATYEADAHNDYGAHYHVVKLFGWLKYQPAYDFLVEALHNSPPQFQKSRAAAALALGYLGDKRAIPDLMTSLDTSIWSLKYAALIALDKLGDNSASRLVEDSDWAVRAKAATLVPTTIK